MKTILLLETDRQLAKNTKDFLTQAGYRVEAHSEPQAAISAADSNCPDIVMLNLVLAGRSGIEFLYEFRSYPEWQHIPVIAVGNLSAEEAQAYSTAFQQLNIANYLPKQTTPLYKLAAEVEKFLQPTVA